MSVDPKVYDQEAKLDDLVLQSTAVGSMDRHLAHQQQMVATFAERVRALASLDGWILATRARVGRLATCAYRLEAADERFSMVCMDLRVRDALVRVCARHCWQRTSCGCRKCVCSACSVRRAHALVCVPHAVPH